MATKAEVRDRAANDLGILRLGQSLQDQDKTRIESAYSEVYAALKKDGIATWASTGAVPDELVPHVAALVAHNCLNTYPASPERYQRIMNAAGMNGAIAKREIRKMVAPDYASPDLPTDY
jgi:hypothetical protein